MLRKLDPGTFGNTPASYKLVEILEENPSYLHLIGSRWSLYTKYIQDIKNSSMIIKTKRHLILLVRHEFKILRQDIPEVVSTHFHNICSAYYRKTLKEIENA